uniref:VWFA domain-containing protein n=1 Tax=Biomphalaria glabrata TaxID=6526 RepID=A0A2C9KD83_BIOGL
MMKYFAVLCLLCVLPKSSHQDTSCRRQMDLVFVIDGSNSLGEYNFNLVLQNVSKAVEETLTIGPNDTRVGVVVYSKTVTAVIQLQTNSSQFKSEILQIDYPDQTTATDLGIKKAVEILLSQRRNVPMTMMIITDGVSDNRFNTESEARTAKLQGIDIWVVGVGKGLDVDELNSIASNGANQTFFIKDFKDFGLQLQNVTIVTCVNTTVNSLVVGPNDTRIGAVLYSRTTAFIEDFKEFSIQLENLTSTACNKIEVPVCRRPIDLVFVIDGSNSLGEDNFNLIIKTVSESVNSLVIGPNDTRVGAVLYSRTVTSFIQLVTDVDAFKKAILGFQYPDETTATDLGIEKAVDLLTSQKRNVPMTMIIITDGESDNRTKTKLQAESAKSKGINIWGVGVGKGLDMTELDNLATNGAQQTVFIGDFQEFAVQLENLTSAACNKIEVPVCSRPIDLVFVIDGSNSLGEDNFNLIIRTVSEAVNSLAIGPNDTRVGAVLYSRTVTNFIELVADVDVFKKGKNNFSLFSVE